MPSVVHGQYEIRESGTYLGEYRVNATKPAGLEDFSNFILEAPPGTDPSEIPADVNGDVPVSGVVIFGGRRFGFESGRLIKGPSGALEELIFTTKVVHGVRFTFSGRFLSRPKQEKPGGDYTCLRGLLTTFQDGRQVAYTDVPFYEFAFM